MSAEPTFNQLRIFNTLWQNRSVNKTAQLLGITSPQVSINLKKLRDFYQDDLFIKKYGAFVPTPMAEELVVEFEEILRRFELAKKKDKNEIVRPEKRTLKVAVNEYAMLVIVPRLIDYLGDMDVGGYSDINLDIEVIPSYLNPNEMYLMLQERGVDLVVDYPADSVSQVVSTPLLTDRWIIVGNADAMLCDYQVEDLYKEETQFVVSKSEQVPRLKGLIESLNVVASLPTIYHVANTIAHTRFLSILPEKAIAVSELHNSVKQCAYPGDPLDFQVDVFGLRRGLEDSQIDILVMALKACCAHV